jgi:hypothetical protein
MTELLRVFPTQVFPVLPLALQDDDPVDLSDKEGIVDPADLKRDDPPPPPPPPEPPPPEPDVPASDFEVDRGGVDDANVPIQQDPN